MIMKNKFIEVLYWKKETYNKYAGLFQLCWVQNGKNNTWVINTLMQGCCYPTMH